jgi:hypothetical protein
MAPRPPGSCTTEYSTWSPACRPIPSAQVTGDLVTETTSQSLAVNPLRPRDRLRGTPSQAPVHDPLWPGDKTSGQVTDDKDAISHNKIYGFVSIGACFVGSPKPRSAFFTTLVNPGLLVVPLTCDLEGDGGMAASPPPILLDQPAPVLARDDRAGIHPLGHHHLP